MPDARQTIIDVMKEVAGVAKKDENTHQNFKFRGIDAVVNAIGPALRKHGGFMMPNVISANYEVGKTSRGNDVTVIQLEVEFQFWGSTGEPLSGRVYSEAFDSGDKATAKAMSVAYRTFMLQLFCLPTDDPDPDSYTYEDVKKVPKGEQVAVDPVDGSKAPQAVLDRIKNTTSINILEKIWNEATEVGYARDIQSLVMEKKKALQEKAGVAEQGDPAEQAIEPQEDSQGL